MKLTAELRPFGGASTSAGEAVSASVDIEGRSSIFVNFRLTGFGERLRIPPLDPSFIKARSGRQADLARQTLLNVMGLGPKNLAASVEEGRTDDLWRSTCFELFARLSDSSYVEFNIAPSGQWAAYCFDGYRSGMANLDGTVEIVEIRHSRDAVELAAWVNWSGWPHVRALGISAVLESVGGNIEYWALAHPAERPDFHHPDSFTLVVRPEAP